MNFYKGIHSACSKAKDQWVHLILIIGLIATIGVTITGCENSTGSDKNENTDEYYVKYEVKSSTIYTGGKLDVILNTESNETTTITINQGKLWETVIGPVQRGFNATLKVNAKGNTHNKLKLYSKIYVSKNDSPFAFKKSDGSDKPRDSVELNYVIDY